jgi:hypothetical protein
MPIQASTLNHTLSTPNKLFECPPRAYRLCERPPEMHWIVLGDPEGLSASSATILRRGRRARSRPCCAAARRMATRAPAA